MSQDNHSNEAINEEITLKELILILKSYISEIWSNWKTVLIASFLFAALFLWQAWVEPPKYNATMTFMVNEDQGNNLGAISGILGNFGFSGGASDYNLEKIIELTRSRHIIQKALFQEEPQKDFIANQIIRDCELHEKWKKDTTGLDGFLFKRGDVEQFNRLENRALKILHNRVIGNPSESIKPLLKISYGEETAVMKMEISSEKEDLSIRLLNAIYNQLSAFYIEKTIEKPLNTYTTLKQKVDSIKSVLESTDYALANEQDSNRGLITKKSSIKKDRLRRNAQILGIAYGKALENLEIADFSLKNATPFFQVIDHPLPPIKPMRESKISAILFGLFLGGILAILSLIIRKIYREAMK